MKKKDYRIDIWILAIALGIIIVILLLGLTIYPEKTMEVLIGLLSFAGAAFIVIVSLHQNHIFKNYAEENNKKQREQDLIIQTVGAVQLQTIETILYCSSSALDLTGGEVLKDVNIEKSGEYNGPFLGLNLIFNGKTDFLSSIHIFELEIENYIIDGDDYISLKKYTFQKEEGIESSIVLRENNLCAVETYLWLDTYKKFDDLLCNMNHSSTKITIKFQVENYFGVVYKKMASINFETKVPSEKERGWFGNIIVSDVRVFDQKMLNVPEIKN